MINSSGSAAVSRQAFLVQKTWKQVLET